MLKLLRNRWLHRALCAGVLIALGVGIYQLQPPAPMCEIDAGSLVPRCFAEDGRRFVTLPTSELPPLAAAEGPMQIWDCRTGAEIGRHFAKDQMLLAPTFARNGGRFAAETASQEPGDKGPLIHTLHFIDLIDNTALEIPLDDDATGELRLTPGGDLLTRLISCKEGKELQIYDGATGGLLTKYVSKVLLVEALTDQAVLFRMQTPPAGWELEIWSVPEQRTLATLPDVRASTCSDDGRLVVLERVSADGVPTGKWAVWSMNDARITGEFDARANAQLRRRSRRTVAGWRCRPPRRAAAPVGKSGLELRELPSGRLATARREEVLAIRFSPDGRWLAAPDPNAPDRLLVMETPTLDVRSSFPMMVREWEFSADSRTAFALPADVMGLAPVELVACDSETGAVRNRFRLLGSQKLPVIRMTPDRRALLMRQGPDSRREGWLDRIPWFSRFLPSETDCAMVIDTNTARERFRLTDWQVRAPLLSDDGGTLATQHDDGFLRCWDVTARKPLYWPIGVPAGLGAVVVLIAWWRGREKEATLPHEV